MVILEFLENCESPWEASEGVTSGAICAARNSPPSPRLSQTYRLFGPRLRIGFVDLDDIGAGPEQILDFGIDCGGVVESHSGQAFADFARKERERLAPIIEKGNIKLN
jgi:hypothetical protein